MEKDSTRLRRAIELSNIGEAYYHLGKYKQSEKYFRQVISNPENTQYLEIMRMSYLYLAQIYEKQGLFKKAYYARKKYNYFLQKQNARNQQQTITNLELRLNLDEKMRLDSLKFAQEMELGKQRLKRQKLMSSKQRIIILLSSLMLFITIVFTLFYRKRYVLNKKQKERISKQNEMLSKQKNQLEITYQKLQDSVEYASRLQNALLPNKKLLKKYFKDYFIFFKPRDQLSGDFYWWTELENNLILAVGDCTGHGVPGALISFIGITLLNEIVGDKKIIDTNKILNELRIGIIKALHQDGVKYNIKDGIDIAIIRFDKQNKTLFFSGAFTSLYILRKQTKAQGLINLEDGLLKKDVSVEKSKNYIIYRIRGDKMPIAAYFRMNNFTEHSIKLNDNDIIYLFTDGFVDQLGGDKKSKYHKKKLQHFLLKISSYAMEIQKLKLSQELLEWRGDYPQVDDILIVGLKV